MEVWSIRWNKTGFFPNCGSVNATVWMHHMADDKTHGEKARWEPHKNTTSYFEQILEATSIKTTAVRPLTSYLKNHPSKTNKTCRIGVEKQGWTYKLRSSPDTHIWTRQSWLTSKNLHQFRADTGCCLEDLWERWMIGTDGEREREREREYGKSVVSDWLDYYYYYYYFSVDCIPIYIFCCCCFLFKTGPIKYRLRRQDSE